MTLYQHKNKKRLNHLAKSSVITFMKTFARRIRNLLPVQHDLEILGLDNVLGLLLDHVHLACDPLRTNLPRNVRAHGGCVNA